jgi:hypothetical protein
MGASKLPWIVVFLAFASTGEAWAQGTKDPSSPVPTMVVPIRPRNEPAPPTAVPNNSYTQQPQQPIRLRRIRPGYPARMYR